MDKTAVTVMVEDFWRSFIPVAFSGDQNTAALIVERFQKQINDMAAIMPNEEAAMFCQMVEEQRERLFQEYNTNPAALKERLGIPDGIASIQNSAQNTDRRMNLGEIAVRTAVRATIWESIRSIFRIIR
ncbi:MAG: hypothetical protein KGN34_17375 [Sphingomonadales bacterium]|nr:hypothetical protein [Sphingomonadales bacterium]